jgi:hypothetical protein
VTDRPLPYAIDDPRLEDVLRRAAAEWGAVEVAVTAALLSDPAEVVRALTETGTVR